MQVRTLFFASYRDALGTGSLELELPDGSTVGELVGRLRARGAPFDRLPSAPAVAVNRTLVRADVRLSAGDEIAFLPGGRGMKRPSVAVVPGPIDAAEVLARVGGPSDGAVLLFLGTVRDHADGRSVGGLHYEAYQAMAEDVLAAIAGEAAERLGTDRIAVVHRVGELAIGDVSVAIAVSSPHRAEAYDASRYVIEEIKKRLPVWKHERYADGDAGWVRGSDLNDAAAERAAPGARPARAVGGPR